MDSCIEQQNGTVILGIPKGGLKDCHVYILAGILKLLYPVNRLLLSLLSLLLSMWAAMVVQWHCFPCFLFLTVFAVRVEVRRQSQRGMHSLVVGEEPNKCYRCECKTVIGKQSEESHEKSYSCTFFNSLGDLTTSREFGASFLKGFRMLSCKD